MLVKKNNARGGYSAVYINDFVRWGESYWHEPTKFNLNHNSSRKKNFKALNDLLVETLPFMTETIQTLHWDLFWTTGQNL